MAYEKYTEDIVDDTENLLTAIFIVWKENLNICPSSERERDPFLETPHVSVTAKNVSQFHHRTSQRTTEQYTHLHWHRPHTDASRYIEILGLWRFSRRPRTKGVSSAAPSQLQD